MTAKEQSGQASTTHVCLESGIALLVMHHLSTRAVTDRILPDYQRNQLIVTNLQHRKDLLIPQVRGNYIIGGHETS